MTSLIKFDVPLPGGGVPLVLGLGVFDGVHLGHRKIISELCDMAVRRHAVPAAVTFHPHPRQVLCPDDPPRLLLPMEERRRLLRDAGAKLVGVIEFDQKFAAMEPLDFLERLRSAPEFHLAGICVGSRWRFGHFGAGDKTVIAAFAEANGIGFSPCEELVIAGETVSSSAIRRAVSAGKLDHARELLARPVRLFGTVGQGNGIAGKMLKAPTANLEVSCGVLPPDGVYAGGVRLGNLLHPAAVNIGLAPTFGGISRRVEVHVLHFDGDLYGAGIVLELYSFIRPERKFASPEALMERIREDMRLVEEDFSRNGPREVSSCTAAG
ncbi:MAG: riboflavin biosynthesis protein RibF [Lentisphaeria bacterium]|nr:riboflavin biosynthesis protein RibF [Lentisphaeria bacterium]